jgi:hypothetical protein
MMSSRLPIPDELYLRIANFLDPRSLLLFALTHKRAFHCVQNSLKDHQAWDVEYRAIHDRSPLLIPTLLTQILEDPQADPLWHLLRFESWGTRLNWGDWDTFGVNANDYEVGEDGGLVESDDHTHLDATYYSDDIVAVMEEVMKTSLMLDEAKTEKWVDFIRAGSDHVLKALLMALAPRLETVVFIA